MLLRRICVETRKLKYWIQDRGLSPRDLVRFPMHTNLQELYIVARAVVFCCIPLSVAATATMALNSSLPVSPGIPSKLVCQYFFGEVDKHVWQCKKSATMALTSSLTVSPGIPIKLQTTTINDVPAVHPSVVA